MKVIRSIVGVTLGIVVAMIVIQTIQFANCAIYWPANGPRELVDFPQWMKQHPNEMHAWLDSMPVTAMVAVLASWQLGAFLGGLVAAFLAGWARVQHSVIIGMLVLISTILNVYMMKRDYGFLHPSWMILLGLVLPLPMSLLAGKLASPRALNEPTEAAS